MTKEKINFYLIVISSLIIGILVNYLFYRKSIGISFFVFVLTIIAFSLVIAGKFEQKLTKTQILILASAIILSAETFLRANFFLFFFNILGTLYLLILAAILFEKNIFSNIRIFKYPVIPIIFLINSLKSSANFVSEQKSLIADKEKFGSKKFRAVIKGIIMSLPLLAVLGLFLYSADQIVQAYANKLFDLLYFKINLEPIVKILITFVVTYIFIGIFNAISKKIKPETLEERNNPKKTTGFIESATVLILVELLFLAFIIIQFFYLFGGKNYIWGLNTYVTYAEYAKNGFFELIIVSIISFILIYVASESIKIETLKEKKIFKFLSAALFIEISIILFSALKRLLLYVDGYGLTFSRFLAFALLFWIFSIFLVNIYKIFLEKKNSVFISMAFFLSIAVWIGINALNPDAFIAKINIERFAQGKELDPYHFSDLSDDAINEVLKTLKLNVSDEKKEIIAMGLNWRYAFRDYNCDAMPYNNAPYYNIYGISQCMPTLFSEKIKNAQINSPWQSFNLSKVNALETLKDNAHEIDKYQISFWKKAVVECKKNATECETSCTKATWQANDDCKITCRINECEEFEKNIKKIRIKKGVRFHSKRIKNFVLSGSTMLATTSTSKFVTFSPSSTIWSLSHFSITFLVASDGSAEI